MNTSLSVVKCASLLSWHGFPRDCCAAWWSQEVALTLKGFSSDLPTVCSFIGNGPLLQVVLNSSGGVDNKPANKDQGRMT